jgi:hypothetical protein
MTVSPLDRMIPVTWSGTGPALANDEVTGYEVHVGPGPDNKILIGNFGGPTWNSWRVLEIRNGHDDGWNGDFKSAEEALASVVGPRP